MTASPWKTPCARQFDHDFLQSGPAAHRPALPQSGRHLHLDAGVASEYAARPPQVPDSVLALASVYQNWRGIPDVENDGVRVMPFSRMLALEDGYRYCLAEVARNRLEMDAGTREAASEPVLLVDPFLTTASATRALSRRPPS